MMTMDRLKKLGVCFIFTLMIFTALFKTDALCDTAAPNLYFDQLSSEDQAVYTAIYENLLAHSYGFTVSENSLNRVNRIFKYVQYDHPGLFWADDVTFDHKTKNGAYIMASYNCSKEEAEIMRTSINLEVLSFIQSFDYLNASDYEKIFRTYMYVLNLVEYDHDESMVHYNQNIQSAFINHKTVCTGYAKTMKYILDALDVETYVVIGSGFSSTEKVLHAWNVVKCDGKYYQMDATWDDNKTPYSSVDPKLLTTKEVLSQFNLKYFMRSDAFMEDTHVYDWADCVYPVCGPENQDR